MLKSSGLLIIKNGKILLAHSKNSNSEQSSYTIPKGKIEKNESKIEAAIRETYEEVGVMISEDEIDKNEYIIDYKSKNGKIYKKLFYFIVNLDYNVEINVDNREIDKADFFTKEESRSKIFWRFLPILDKF